MGREALEAAIENYKTGGKKKHEIEGNIVCTCFGVTDREIERVVRENNLTTVEEVTNYCKAGGGCGGCKGEIEKIIQSVQGDKLKEKASAIPHKAEKLTNIQKIQLIQQTINEQIKPSFAGTWRKHRTYRCGWKQSCSSVQRHVCTMHIGGIHNEGFGRSQASRVCVGRFVCRRGQRLFQTAA